MGGEIFRHVGCDFLALPGEQYSGTFSLYTAYDSISAQARYKYQSSASLRNTS